MPSMKPAFTLPVLFAAALLAAQAPARAVEATQDDPPAVTSMRGMDRAGSASRDAALDRMAEASDRDAHAVHAGMATAPMQQLLRSLYVGG